MKIYLKRSTQFGSHLSHQACDASSSILGFFASTASSFAAAFPSATISSPSSLSLKTVR
jgi:hypothetical protein